MKPFRLRMNACGLIEFLNQSFTCANVELHLLAPINIRFSVGVIGSSGVRFGVLKEHTRKKGRDRAIKFGRLISPLASNTREDN